MSDGAHEARARRDRRKVRWGIRLGGPLLRLLGWTWRVDEGESEAWTEHRRSGKAFLISTWHGALLPHVWTNRSRGICAMVSQHGDGEIIARIIERLGFRAVRGSSSRGGKEALIDMVRELKAGSVCAITPDGPRGPAGVPHPGVLLASIRSGAPIVPIRCTVSRTWRMNSWDGFLLPKPFARIRVEYGEPWYPASADEATMAEFVRRMGPPPPPGRGKP